MENIRYLSLSRNSFQSCQFGPITIQNLSRAFLPIHIFRRHKELFFFKEPKLHLLRLVELHAIIARCYLKNIIFIENSNGNTKKKKRGFGLTVPTENWDLGKVIELTLSFIKLIIKVRLLLVLFSIIFIPKEFLQSRKTLNQALNRKL